MTEELQTRPLIFIYLFCLVNTLNSNSHSVQEHQTAKDEMLRTVCSVSYFVSMWYQSRTDPAWERIAGHVEETRGVRTKEIHQDDKERRTKRT